MAERRRLGRLQICVVGHQAVLVPQGHAAQCFGRRRQRLSEAENLIAEREMVGRRQRLAPGPSDAQPTNRRGARKPRLSIGVEVAEFGRRRERRRRGMKL